MIEYVLQAKEESKKSIDPTRGVGALLLKNTDDTVISRGHNTFPFWLDISKLSTMSKDEKGVLATHAEVECLENTHNSFVPDGGEYTMVISCSPCINCSMAIVNSSINITKVFYLKTEQSREFKLRFRILESKQYLIDNNIEVNEICLTPLKTLQEITQQTG